jgi:hypothetical protein
LAALAVICENSVICGFFDREFGIVSIGTPEIEPQIFDETEISVLGAIVGVGCQDEKFDKNFKLSRLVLIVSKIA